jgi:hypothetical protein
MSYNDPLYRVEVWVVSARLCSRILRSFVFFLARLCFYRSLTPQQSFDLHAESHGANHAERSQG